MCFLLLQNLNPQQGNFNQRPGGYPPRNDMQGFGNQPTGLMGNRPGPWAPNNNQWNPNPVPGPQMGHNNFGFQQGPNQAYPQQQVR